MWTFLRLLKNSKLFVANTYKNNLQTFSSAVQYINNNELKFMQNVQGLAKTDKT